MVLCVRDTGNPVYTGRYSGHADAQGPAPPMSELEASNVTRSLRDSGFAVMQGLYDSSRVDRLRAAVGRVYAEAGSPTPYDSDVRWLGTNLQLTTTGFVVHKLLGFAPELQQGVLHPTAVEAVRGLLSDEMHLEMVGAVVANHTRPFFEWHMHVGGIDDERYRRRGWAPTFARAERVAMLVYLDEMGPGTGQLLVHPRKVTDPLEPPFPRHETHWPGQTTVSGPAGTVVLMEQGTWHAVLPRTVDETCRFLVGFWFAAPWATEAHDVDESLSSLRCPDETLASVLPRAPHR